MDKSLFTQYVLENSGVTQNFAIGVQTGISPIRAGTGAALTSQSDDITKSMTFKPDLYLNEIRNYTYFRTLLNILKAPIAEGIDQINGEITVVPEDPDNELIKDACIIVNNFFAKSRFKQFLKDHLEEFIMRGSYLAFIDYKHNKLREVCNPYDFQLIHNGEEFSWIIPAEDNRQNNELVGTSSLLGSMRELYSDNKNIKGMYGNMFVKYYYELETVKYESRSFLDKLPKDDASRKNMEILLGGKIDFYSDKRLTEDTKKRLDQMLILYSIKRPKSLLEPFLKRIFTLAIKEMVFDMLSLLQYLKADYFTVSIRADTPEDESVAGILTNIRSALNRFNKEFIKTFEDPSGIIRHVYDKLINHAEVLPMVDEFSDIQLLNIPDIEQRLSTLYQDIVESKRTIADEAGIAQETVSGGANRWEAISRNEKMTLNVMYIKSTIENFVKDAAVAIFFNHANESYWDFKYNSKSYPTTFHFSNSFHTLSREPQGINQILFNIPPQEDGLRIGVKTSPMEYQFNLNLSTILDSYASKTKETIISETFQSITNVLDTVKNFANYIDIVDTEQLSELITSILNVGDYTAKIIDIDKLKEMFNAPPPSPEEQQMEAEGMNDGMGDEMYGGPEYFSSRLKDWMKDELYNRRIN